MTLYSSVRHSLRTAKQKVRFYRNQFRTNGEIFDRIYNEAHWGGASGDIYSGNGSGGEIADIYVRAIVTFLNEIDCASVVDVGCGDFRIGSKIASAVPEYIGIDVSRVAIDRNKQMHTQKGVSFEVCDAEHDLLPPGDVCLIRQVLQHLSNKSIKTILDRLLATYRYIVITEHMPSKQSFRGFNFDKPTGADIRGGHGSGVYVEMPPFGLVVERTLLEVPLPKEQSYKTKFFATDPSSWEYLKTVVVMGKRHHLVNSA